MNETLLINEVRQLKPLLQSVHRSLIVADEIVSKVIQGAEAQPGAESEAESGGKDWLSGSEPVFGVDMPGTGDPVQGGSVQIERQQEPAPKPNSVTIDGVTYIEAGADFWGCPDVIPDETKVEVLYEKYEHWCKGLFNGFAVNRPANFRVDTGHKHGFMWSKFMRLPDKPNVVYCSPDVMPEPQPAGTERDPIIHRGDDGIELLHGAERLWFSDDELLFEDEHKADATFRAYVPPTKENCFCYLSRANEIWKYAGALIDGKYHVWRQRDKEVQS